MHKNDILLHVGSKWGPWSGLTRVAEIEDLPSEWLEEPLEMTTVSTPGILCLGTDEGVEFVLFRQYPASEAWGLANVVAEMMVKNGGTVGDFGIDKEDDGMLVFLSGIEAVVDEGSAHQIATALVMLIMSNVYGDFEDFLDILSVLKEGGAAICR